MRSLISFIEKSLIDCPEEVRLIANNKLNPCHAALAERIVDLYNKIKFQEQ